MTDVPRVTHRSIVLAACVLMPPGAISAQTNEHRPFIQVAAESTVVASPNQVEIDLGVTTQAPRSREAAIRNAELVKSVLEALTHAAGPSANVRTISYTFTPEYRHPKDRGRPAITGYTATNMVRASLNELDRVGDVVDAATRAGANQIHRIQFGLKDQQAVQTQALREAVMKARAQADALAAALGVKVARILSVTESQRVVRPYDVMRLGMEAAAQSTPIEPGSIEVSATVTLSVEIAPS